MKGKERPDQSHVCGRLWHLVRTFLHMDVSFELIPLFSGRATPSDNSGYTM